MPYSRGQKPFNEQFLTKRNPKICTSGAFFPRVFYLKDRPPKAGVSNVYVFYNIVYDISLMYFLSCWISYCTENHDDDGGGVGVCAGLVNYNMKLYLICLN